MDYSSSKTVEQLDDEINVFFSPYETLGIASCDVGISKTNISSAAKSGSSNKTLTSCKLHFADKSEAKIKGNDILISTGIKNYHTIRINNVRYAYKI